MTTRGRQYPDSPLVPDPDVIYRPLQQPAWPSSGTPEQFWPDGAGEVLHNILGGSEPEPGPPYTHTIVPAEREYGDDGEEIWQPEPPAYALTGIPLTELVDPAMPAWLAKAGAACMPKPSPLREVTRQAVASPVRLELGEPIGGSDEFRWSPYRSEILADTPARCWFGDES